MGGSSCAAARCLSRWSKDSDRMGLQPLRQCLRWASNDVWHAVRAISTRGPRLLRLITSAHAGVVEYPWRTTAPVPCGPQACASSVRDNPWLATISCRLVVLGLLPRIPAMQRNGPRTTARVHNVVPSLHRGHRAGLACSAWRVPRLNNGHAASADNPTQQTPLYTQLRCTALARQPQPRPRRQPARNSPQRVTSPDAA